MTSIIPNTQSPKAKSSTNILPVKLKAPVIAVVGIAITFKCDINVLSDACLPISHLIKLNTLCFISCILIDD